MNLDWVEPVWRRVASAQPLHGGWTSTMLRLTADDGGQAVLRLMTKEPWRRHAPGLLAREAAVQRQLAGSGIPAPRSIAVDLSGERAGAPAHLMSWLPGRLCLDSASDDVLGAMARLLARIHQFDPGDARPREFQSWAAPAKRVVPDWAERPDLWKSAFELLEKPAPDYAGAFLHRDFHLGNLLWDGGRISGVVDWVETSWGPAELDVAHAATSLAMLHGVEAAERFTASIGDGTRFWHVMDIVGFLPDQAKVVRPWRDAGVAVSETVARRRLEERLASVV
ncbi:aminoglycoside phosphotransferase family protein [Actinoplanes sp. LDG1-06]|uniref:Aminoglycoside phosphotransferase family protein n=1 Tax=Paractinoplanes ovalisporus TaxID=2810368 RepID=A0ABS2A7F7_9ACTN|nr:aminoglycoside phosphotransferase family protein [Actinoplanes ovalisporus]MBM2615772.1 aminoglycoside phosphotransferase family protein [Actinoplanes ovalisporus]